MILLVRLLPLKNAAVASADAATAPLERGMIALPSTPCAPAPTTAPGIIILGAGVGDDSGCAAYRPIAHPTVNTTR